MHTPGPWKAEKLNEDTWLIGSNYNRIIGDVWAIDVGTPAANARLIAAAPDLLAALERLVDFFGVASNTGSSPVRTWSEVQAAKAAIAKAKGEKDDGSDT